MTSSCSQEFAKVPRILVTAEHTHENNMHDAASIWVEDPDKDSFKVCFRELQNFDGIHKNIKIVSQRLYYNHAVT